jgi:hypothetical protein
MKKSPKHYFMFALICLVIGSFFACQSSADKLYYAMETQGEIYGYDEVSISRIEDNGKPLIRLKENLKSTSSLLGAHINTKIQSEYLIDPETGHFTSHEFDLDQESIKLHITTTIEENRARIIQEPGGTEKEVSLPSDVILGNSCFSPHLLKDFGQGGLDRKRYKTLDVLDREIHEITFAKRGTEQIELAGNRYNAIVFDTLNHETGAKVCLWINAENGYLLKAEGPTSILSLADKSVKHKIRRANIDDLIIARVDLAISDIHAISYMKVKATLEPVGNWITPQSLNISGQSFEGTVEDNLILGTFEVSHKRYDGGNAPPFPPDFSDNPELQPFLNPEDFIESDDPVLIRKARELTEGAGDSWEAAKRLSRWVAEEIGYDIPGGASARNTFDLREGECGAHSRLFAAFCRAVGIPARVVWGCMYVPNYGGGFGQHGWNEVYMGEVGWIPIDTTAREIDFADSGHIRLGILASKHIAFNPKQMEILDFRAGYHRFGEVKESGSLDEYESYIGRYRGPRRMLKILVQNGNLAVDIPGKGIFELKEPNEEGLWFFKLTRDASISFHKDNSDRVRGMTIHSLARLPKKPQPETSAKNVPEEYRSYLGKYPIPMENDELTVSYRNKNLALKDSRGRIMNLEGPDEKRMWRDKRGKNKISFVVDDEGKVRAMVYHETVYFPRID